MEGPASGLEQQVAGSTHSAADDDRRRVEDRGGGVRVTDDVDYLTADDELEFQIAQANAPVDADGTFVESSEAWTLRHACASGVAIADFDRDGDLVGTYRKIHRFGFGNGEPKLLEAGEEVIVLDLALGDRAGGAMAASSVLVVLNSLRLTRYAR